MFKLNDFENEILQSMEKTLVANQFEQSYKFNKVAKAIDLLNNAAQIFDQAGFVSEAMDIEDILKSVTNDSSNNQSKDSDDDDGGGGKVFVTKDNQISENDMQTLLKESTPAKLLELFKKIKSIHEGDSTLSNELDKAVKEHDLSNPDVRQKLIDKVMSAMKIAEFF